MFKKLFCKHTYKFYNTRVEYPLCSSCGYNVFQFVCTKCGKEKEVSQIDINDIHSELKSRYNKYLALGGEPMKSSWFSIPRHMNIGIRYESPVATLVIEEYLKQGIDLRQIDS